MSISNIIGKGIGFTPGSVKFIPTHGFSIGAESPAGNICLSATDMRNIGVGASFNNNVSLGASANPDDDLSGDWATC